MKNFLLLTLFFSILNQVEAQTSTIELKADQHFNKFDFDKAIDKYLEVGVEVLSTDGLRNLATSYRLLHIDTSAEQYYALLIEREDHKTEDLFMYAEMLQMNQKTSESEVYMNKFHKELEAQGKATAYNTKEGSSKGLEQDLGEFKVVHLDINTPKEDFGPAFYGDKIVFASSRTHSLPQQTKWNWNDFPFLNIYEAKKIDSSEYALEKPKMLSKEVNKKYHEGPASFSKDGKLMVFTRNNYEQVSSDGARKLKMFYRDLNEQGEWSDPVGYSFNNKEYSVGHPSVSEDGKTVYFASDMPGGKGKSDIYRITRAEDGSWSSPENLGAPINTEEDEMFPFYHQNNMLFFASKGHVGLGGHDIFVSNVKENAFAYPRNLRSPINGYKDDFALILDENQKFGYFSSNREGGKGSDDIYAFTLSKPITFCIDVKGYVKSETGELLPETQVLVFDDQGQEIQRVLSTKESSYQTCLEEGDYTVQSLVEGYEQYNKNITITQNTENPLLKDIILKKLPEVSQDTDTNKSSIAGVTIEDGNIKGFVDEKGEVIYIENIYFDFDKSYIRKDASEELDKIVSIMNKYPEMMLELGSHTDCRAPKSYNVALSSRRAKSSAAYIKKRISNPDRIFGRGYGEDRLLVDCPCEPTNVSDCSEAQHQMNRRTEFKVVKTGGANIINKSTNSFDK